MASPGRPRTRQIILDGAKVKALREATGKSQTEFVGRGRDPKMLRDAEHGRPVPIKFANWLADKVEKQLQFLMPGTRRHEAKGVNVDGSVHVKLLPLTADRVAEFVGYLKRRDTKLEVTYDLAPEPDVLKVVEASVATVLRYPSSVLQSHEGPLFEIRALGEIIISTRELESKGVFTYYAYFTEWKPQSHGQHPFAGREDRRWFAPTGTPKLHVRYSQKKREAHELRLRWGFERAQTASIRANFARDVLPSELDKLRDPPFSASFKAIYAEMHKKHKAVAARDGEP